MNLPPAKTVVPPSGRLNSDYVFVGEQPGRVEVKVRQPFKGPAGQELDKDMNAAQISRPESYLTNVIKDLDRHKDAYIQLYKNKKLLKAPIVTPLGQQQLDFLKWELEQTSAKVFGAVGAISLFALTGKTGINKWRGSVLDCTLVEGRKVVPLLHPATIIKPKYQFLNRRLIIFDLKRLNEIASNLYVPTEREIMIEPSFYDAIEFLHYCHKKGLCGNRVSYDIEVFMSRVHKHVSCIALAVGLKSMCIPFVDWKGDYFVKDQEIEIWKMIANILEDQRIRIVAQNAVFDCHFLLRTLGIRVNNLDDTMIAQNIVLPDYPKGLHFITSIFTDHPYYKDDGKDFIGLTSESYKKYWIYNATDAVICSEAINRQAAELERLEDTQIYRNQVEVIGPLVYMMERGIRTDVEGMRQLNVDYERKIETAQIKLNGIAGEPLNANSNKQLYEYFCVKKKLKPYTKNKKPTFDDDAIKRFIRRGFEEAKWIKEIRRLVKLRSTYLDLDKISSDGRFKCSYNPAGTRFSRLSSSKNIWGEGCLMPEAEVLTPEGWIMLKNLKKNMLIAEWSPSGVISWTTPNIVKYKNKHKYMIRADSTVHKNCYTLDHRIPKLTKRGFLSVGRAGKLFMESNWFLPLSGIYNEGKGCDLSARILAMIQADGSIEKGGVRLTFKKHRKIDRCLKLLISAEFNFTEQTAEAGFRRFYIRTADAKRYVDFLGPNKLLSEKLLHFTQTQMQEFIHEAAFWDGHIRNRSYQYFTAIKQNAEWIATISHLIGYSATINKSDNNKHVDSYGSNTVLWTVNIKPRFKAYQSSDMYSVEEYSGDVYCLQTLTSFFMCRYQDRICVTGNSNSQNWPHELQEFLLPDVGYVYYAFDLEQAENRIVANVGEIVDMIECFETGRDVHSRTALMIMNVYYGGKIPEDVNVRSKSPLGDGTHSWRFYGKKSNHGFNYDLGYKNFALVNELAENDGRMLYNAYHKLYPGVQQGFQSYVRFELRKKRMLTNLMGRQTLFMGALSGPKADNTFKEAYACIPQGTVGDLVNKQGLNYVYNDQKNFNKVELLRQVHDEIGFQIPLSVPWEDHAKILTMIKNSLEVELTTHNGRKFTIPAGLAIGKTLNKSSGKEMPIITAENLKKAWEKLNE